MLRGGAIESQPSLFMATVGSDPATYIVKTGLSPSEFLGESISWFLSKILGFLVVSAGAVSWGESVPCWGMEYIDSATAWDPKYRSLVRNPHGLAGMIALDLLVWNADRHARNVLCRWRKRGDVVVYAIDHASASIFLPDAGGYSPTRGLPLLLPASGNEDLKAPPDSFPWELIVPALRGIPERVRRCVDSAENELSDYVKDACDLAGCSGQYQSLNSLLHARMDNLDNLIREHIELLCGFQRIPLSSAGGGGA